MYYQVIAAPGNREVVRLQQNRMTVEVATPSPLVRTCRVVTIVSVHLGSTEMNIIKPAVASRRMLLHSSIDMGSIHY